MPTFRCSAGHEAALVFGDEQVRHRCPTCGVDVYKYRDAVLDGDSPADAAAEAPAAPRRRLALDPKQMRIAIGALCLVGAAALLLQQRSAPPAVPPSSTGPVIPPASGVATATATAAAPATAKPAPAAVTITDFSAVATDAGTVKAAFRLTNGAGAPNDYPALAVHWHGAPGADHVIGKDSYAHPPLPFTTADVILELERPQGATGMDVRLAY